MARHIVQQRLIDAVTSRGGLDLDALGEEVIVEPWMVVELRAAEASIRRMRRQIEERLAGTVPRLCAGCGAPLAGRADRRYCSGRCRQAAHRSRLAGDD